MLCGETYLAGGEDRDGDNQTTPCILQIKRALGSQGSVLQVVATEIHGGAAGFPALMVKWCMSGGFTVTAWSECREAVATCKPELGLRHVSKSGEHGEWT